MGTLAVTGNVSFANGGRMRVDVDLGSANADLLAVSGTEALAYLQGQCSQDLAPLGVGDSTEALLLSRPLGPLVPMPAAALDELKRAFGVE